MSLRPMKEPMGLETHTGGEGPRKDQALVQDKKESRPHSQGGPWLKDAALKGSGLDYVAWESLYPHVGKCAYVGWVARTRE